MIKDIQRSDLIKYRIDQAKATKNEAKLMIENDMFRGAINRIYYAMFYMVLALALKYEFDSSKHGQLIGWFNKTFIKEAVIERRFGKMLREAFEHRQKNDYAVYIEYTKKEVKTKYVLMKDFLSYIEEFILNNQPLNNNAAGFNSEIHPNT
ncbi:antitoxin [Candidatus Magnetomorum sp. HK-1]|jgi:uncharacterized protein (UPF0332 family)|nr:antitoxin [Candidatus Magnetomorum sp. HK-1]